MTSIAVVGLALSAVGAEQSYEQHKEAKKKQRQADELRKKQEAAIAKQKAMVEEQQAAEDLAAKERDQRMNSSPLSTPLSLSFMSNTRQGLI